MSARRFGGPSPDSTAEAVLRDGRSVLLRAVRPDDAPRLVEFHSRLSPETQYLRFFGPKPRLTDAEAHYLANVDFDRRFAIVATIREDGADRIVAVGRFDLVDADTAEVAVVVRDDHQHAGLGTEIFEQLKAAALSGGVRAFAGEVLAENERMLRLLRHRSASVGTSHAGIRTVSKPLGARAS